MATDRWLEYNGAELVNLSRTAQLTQTLGIDTVWVTPESVQWVEDALGGVGYEDITTAPWYDAGYEASAEFAGIVPLSLAGLDDSTLESTTIEYTTNGGNSGAARSKTLTMPANFVIIASTDRGADFGKRWLDRLLRNTASNGRCSGADLTYFRFIQREGEPVPPQAHRREVGLTRGTSVTRKRSTDCSTLWWVTFTLTADDPFEYGEPVEQFSELGGVVTGPGVEDSGSVVLTQQSCPVYNYQPIYDPLYPALVAPPSVPDFYPAGWNIYDGMTFERFWTTLTPVEPSSLNLVPVITLSSITEARMVRVSVWPGLTEVDEQCDPLFSIVVGYLPPDVDFVIDGEQQASYVWDGISPIVRRADSLVYGPDATPVDWTAFNDPDGLLVALDIFSESGVYEGGGDVRVAMSLVPKSD